MAHAVPRGTSRSYAYAEATSADETDESRRVDRAVPGASGGIWESQAQPMPPSLTQRP